MVWCGKVWCGHHTIVWYGMVWYGTLPLAHNVNGKHTNPGQATTGPDPKLLEPIKPKDKWPGARYMDNTKHYRERKCLRT